MGCQHHQAMAFSTSTRGHLRPPSTTPTRLGAFRLWLWASCCRTAAFSRSQPNDYPHRRTLSRFCCKALLGVPFFGLLDLEALRLIRFAPINLNISNAAITNKRTSHMKVAATLLKLLEPLNKNRNLGVRYSHLQTAPASSEVLNCDVHATI
jgi:hypothetical protein